MHENKNERVWWVYLLACKNERLYAGVALDVEARFALHVTGKGARFTRANRPERILAAKPFPSRSLAQKAECALKKLDKASKLKWAREHARPRLIVDS
ncbi:MAG TPA: GIY-YIG nuclease family protein [Steroidobacteraceae bacterium]